MKKPFLILIFILAYLQSNAQAIIPFDSAHWNIQGKEIKLEDYQGQQSLKIVDGAASLKDTFENGVIEFDINFENNRCFPGLMFRMTDDKNYEFLYLRPHQSGNPDAIQYCPIFFGTDTWQLYFGEGFTAQKVFTYNSWLHVKVIVSGSMAELYLGSETQPTLFMHQLKQLPMKGGLALDNHSPSAVHFANFSYLKQEHPVLKSEAKIVRPLDGGYITNWQISNAFEEKSLNKTYIIKNSDLKSLSWQKEFVEELGFVNIGRFVKKTNDANTVFTKFNVKSDKDQIKKLALGFSDRCRVYLNGVLLYSGSNTFKSRDYRFYGTIGLWDNVFLQLKKGNNEILIAISENFGGWGVEAKFDDLEDVTLVEQ